jgi:hypothetical protein
MVQVLDYSAGFPGAQAIRAAGYAGAVRYIGFPGRRKCTTRAELDDFTAHQLGMALIFEDTLTTWRTGRAGGQRSAQLARAHATSIGWPTGYPIYFATDQDVVTAAEFAAMLEYLRGAGDVLGGRLVGVYGEADVIDAARTAGVASWFWQTAAWSRGRKTTCNLYQHVGTVYVGGVACDVNDVDTPMSWGQHTGSTSSLMEDDVAFTDKITVASPGDRSYTEFGEAAKFLGDAYFWSADIYKMMIGQVLPALTAIAANHGADPDVVTAAIGDAVKAGTESAMVTTILPALGPLVQAAVAGAVGEDRAADAEAISAAILQSLAAKITAAPTG